MKSSLLEIYAPQTKILEDNKRSHVRFGVLFNGVTRLAVRIVVKSRREAVMVVVKSRREAVMVVKSRETANLPVKAHTFKEHVKSI